MKSKQRLSLIISNYNYGEFLYDTVSAALGQTRRPDEIILIDDCSSDHSRELISRIEKEVPIVRTIYNSTNLGCNRSINEALRTATGDYVCSAGADDPLHDPTFFERALALCSAHPDVSFCYGEHMLQYQTGTVQFTTPISMGLANAARYFSPADVVALYRSRHTLSVPTSPALWNRSALIGVGGLRHELGWVADWFAALVLSARTGACHIPGVYQTIRFSPKSFSQSGMAAQKAYRELLVTLLETLEHPEFSDVQPFFKIPAVLSRHGFKLLNVLTHDARFSKYLSLDLLRCLVQAENLSFVVDLDRFGANPPVTVVLDVCRNVAKTYGKMLRKMAEQERYKGRLSAALTFCRQAVDAAPEDTEIASLYTSLADECSRWSRIEGRN